MRILSVRVKREVDTDPDLSYLGEYSRTAGPNAIDRQERGDMAHGELRYFNAAMSGEETGNPESPEQDYQRCEDYNRQGWCMLGITAVAKVVVNGVIQTVTSGGLWGIESDGGEEYFREVADEELAELRDILVALGFDESTVMDATAQAKTVKV
jgi:hypothetical protein